MSGVTVSRSIRSELRWRFPLVAVCGVAVLACVFLAGQSVHAQAEAQAPPSAGDTDTDPSPAETAPANGAPGPDTNGDGAKPDAYRDYAEIYVDRYIPPSGNLKLKDGGAARAESFAEYAKALSLEHRGDFNGALKAYDHVLELRPGELYLARKVARMSAQEGRPDKGRAILEHSLELNADNPDAYIALSEFLATYFTKTPEDREAAVKTAELAVQKFPDEPGVYDHMVTIYLVAKQREKAREILNGGLARTDDDPYYWLQMAQIAQRVWTMPRNAEEEPIFINGIYQKAIDAADGDALVLEKVADYYSLSQQFEKARDLYQEIIRRHPEELDAREKLARVFGILGDQNGVTTTLEELVQINQEDPTTHKFLGRVYQEQGDFENAVLHYQKALKLEQGSATEYLQVANILLSRLKQPEEAARVMERALFHFPDSEDISYMLAVAYSYSERHADAVKTFERTVDLAAKLGQTELNHLFYYQYAVANERLGDFDRAGELFRKTIELLPPDGDQEFSAGVYNYLGYMWLEQNTRIDEAGELIRMAHNLDPENGAILDSLGWFHFLKGRYTEAQADLLKASEKMEEPDAVVFDHLAQAYFQGGQKEEAVSWMQKAVDLEPDNREYRERLAKFIRDEPPAPPPAPNGPGAMEDGKENGAAPDPDTLPKNLRAPGGVVKPDADAAPDSKPGSAGDPKAGGAPEPTPAPAPEPESAAGQDKGA